MRALLLILLISFVASAQDVKDLDDLHWKPIKEMSGDIPGHVGLTMDVYVAEIARRENGVKLLLRVDYPWGSPSDLFTTAPKGLDKTSVSRIQGQFDFDCSTKTATPLRMVEFFQFTGKRWKFDKFVFHPPAAETFAQYFCEQGLAPTTKPVLKHKP